ncbi:MAG TPA: MFS transporter, partial [Methylomirabilota bacterium]
MSQPASVAPATRWRLLAILTASYGAGAFGMLGISPLSPSLVDGLGLTRFQVAFLVPSIYLAGLLFSLPGGRLADRLGVRPAFLGGLAVAAIGLLAAALAPGFLAFLACLFAAGSGWSVVNPALGKAIMDVFPTRERGIAMGIKQMGLTLGGLVAALALPAVAATLGWR